MPFRLAKRLPGEAQDQGLILKIAGAAIPAIVRFAIAGERGVEADDAGFPSFLDPRDQLVAAPDAEAAEIDDLEFPAAPLAQPGDALQGFGVVIGGRADKDADVEIGPLGQPPIVETVHECLKAGKRQAAALPRL
ncbi:MAG TPA: hypothetical protein VJ770_09890 [Stellaceae bacterium]|nr:hypothetical protein [Stellaceae bacterium]